MGLKGTHFTNFRTLAKFIWRRDRVRIPIWLISLIGITISVAIVFPGLYPPGPERDILAETMKNPAMTSGYGPSNVALYSGGRSHYEHSFGHPPYKERRRSGPH